MALSSILDYGVARYCSAYFGSLYRWSLFSTWKIFNTKGKIFYSKNYDSSKESQVVLLNSHKFAYSNELFEWACRNNYGIFAKQIADEIYYCDVELDPFGNVKNWKVKNYIIGTEEKWIVNISDVKEDYSQPDYSNPAYTYCIKYAEFVRVQ
jgi:hypothetical protein